MITDNLTRMKLSVPLKSGWNHITVNKNWSAFMGNYWTRNLLTLMKNVKKNKNKKNKKTYFDTYPANPKVCERVFVTPEGRTNFFDIRNETVSEIQQCILNMIKVCV